MYTCIYIYTWYSGVGVCATVVFVGRTQPIPKNNNNNDVGDELAKKKSAPSTPPPTRPHGTPTHTHDVASRSIFRGRERGLLVTFMEQKKLPRPGVSIARSNARIFNFFFFIFLLTFLPIPKTFSPEKPTRRSARITFRPRTSVNRSHYDNINSRVRRAEHPVKNGYARTRPILLFIFFFLLTPVARQLFRRRTLRSCRLGSRRLLRVGVSHDGSCRCRCRRQRSSPAVYTTPPADQFRYRCAPFGDRRLPSDRSAPFARVDKIYSNFLQVRIYFV